MTGGDPVSWGWFDPGCPANHVDFVWGHPLLNHHSEGSIWRNVLGATGESSEVPSHPAVRDRCPPQFSRPREGPTRRGGFRHAFFSDFQGAVRRSRIRLRLHNVKLFVEWGSQRLKWLLDNPRNVQRVASRQSTRMPNIFF